MAINDMHSDEHEKSKQKGVGVILGLVAGVGSILTVAGISRQKDAKIIDLCVMTSTPFTMQAAGVGGPNEIHPLKAENVVLDGYCINEIANQSAFSSSHRAYLKNSVVKGVLENLNPDLVSQPATNWAQNEKFRSNSGGMER